MATTTAQGSGSTVNDGGTVVNGGNIASDGPMTNNRSLVELADGGTDYGSKVVQKNVPSSNDFSGVIGAKGVGAGTLAFAPNAQEGERNFLIRGAGTADGNNEINNSASDLLVLPASEVALRQVNPIHLTIASRQLGADDATFNVLARPSTAMVPGRSKGTGAGSASTFVNPADGTAAVATEILPSRAVPGELTYHFGSLSAPTTDEYKARDSYEV